MARSFHAPLKVAAAFFLVATSVLCASRDVTLEDRTAGATVVEAALRKIQFSEIFFNQDLGFLRRVAYVESRDGALPETFSNPERKGIWQIDATRFSQTKEASLLTPSRVLKLREKLRVDWSNVTFDDLNTPFYGALAAQLLVARQGDLQLLPEAEAQANDWYKLFRGSVITTKAADKFIADAEELDEKETLCDAPSMDLVFVVESDMEQADFQSVLSFLHSAVDFFDIGASKVRVGVVLSSEQKTQTVIPLSATQNKTQLMEAIATIESAGYRGLRQAGINEMVDSTFQVANGARPLSEGVPRVGVIVAVGNELAFDNVTVAVSRARNASVRLIAVAVSSIDPNVARSVASFPNKYNLFNVNLHSHLVTYASPLRRLVCSASTLLDARQRRVTSQLQRGQKRFVEFQPSLLQRSAVKVDVSQGEVLVYASMEYPNPSEVLHSQKASVKAGKSVTVDPRALAPERPNSTELWHGYVTVQVLSDRASFSVDFTDGYGADNVNAAPQRLQLHVAAILCLLGSALAVLNR